MLDEEDLALVPELFVKDQRDDQSLAEPVGDNLHEISKRKGIRFDVIEDDPLEFEKWLFIKRHIVDVVDRQVRRLQTVIDRAIGEGGGILLPVEPLLLGRGNDPAVFDERRCGIMIVAGESQDVHINRVLDFLVEFVVQLEESWFLPKCRHR